MKTRMQPNDRVLGGSTGKIFVSAALMQLIEKKRLNLDDKASKYLSDYNWFNQVQNYNKLTIKHLLQHASGISRYVFEIEFQKAIQKDPDRKWMPDELISYVLNKAPLFETGTDFVYSDTNYILLGLIIEKVK